MATTSKMLDHERALGLSRAVLRTLLILNIGAGALLVASFAGTFIVEPFFIDFFSKRPPRIDSGLLMLVLRIWMLLAIPAIAAVHVALSRLLAMVEAVRARDPFAPGSAARVKTVAWSMIVIQVFDLVCVVMAAAMNAAGSNIDWSLSVTGWVAVVLLFVLARLFEEGTGIRDNLEAII